jgi:uncharacterized protein (TIGR03435 family)
MQIGARGGPGTKDPERWTAQNSALQSLVQIAYNVMPYELFGPDWMGSERYNIEAKVPARATRAQFLVMLQNLLAERLHLKVHRETREMPLYDLVIAKNGSKLRDVAADGSEGGDKPTQLPSRTFDASGFPTLPPGNQSYMRMIAVKGGMAASKRGHAESMEQLITMLSVQLRIPVKDATGLKGKFDYTLQWISPNEAASADAQPDGPTLFEAVQQQLGLKLESKKGPVEVLVVDHADKTPVEN